MFSDSDLKQIEVKGIPPEKVKEQLERFRTGFPYLNIVKPATLHDGIIGLMPEEIDSLVEIYRTFEGKRVKFVPASGAATRMFKHLYRFLEEFPIRGKACLEDISCSETARFFENIERFPFYEKLSDMLHHQGYTLKELMDTADYLPIIHTLLDTDGLSYGSLPKGLLLFHRYDDITRTALEEHLVEGAKYSRDPHGNVSIHLTVSPEHKNAFSELINRVKPFYENHFDISLSVSFSVQHTSTDTIAVDLANNPIRNADGTLHFRPGGHGALIENLNEIDADIVFIKNIDNVAPDYLKPVSVLYKKALAGLLISYRGLIFSYVHMLEETTPILEELHDILDFTRDELFIIPPGGFDINDYESLKSYLLAKLNRPLRVCGMVKNSGEPGGGPFWAINPDGTISLQIVESAQLDMTDKKTLKLAESATHFNPVDIVCSVRNHRGEKFDLSRYTDPDTGIITTKSREGKPIKALELPGLWNGAMSDWITVFVEVPVETFTPVKTVNDLLRNEHQNPPFYSRITDTL